METPQISVITVCFNAADSIERTIDSVVNQSCHNIEYIIVDGGSSDGTQNVIKKYKDCIDFWISEPDKGIYDAMNKGIRFASGKWILFLNSGDVFYDNSVLKNVSGVLKKQNTVYYGDVILTPQNIRFGGKYNKWKISTGNICHQSIFYPRVAFQKYMFITKYRLYADWVLNVMFMGDDAIHFKHIPVVVALYDTNGTSSSGDDAFLYRDRFAIVRKYLGIPYLLYMSIRNFFHNLRSKDLFES